MAITVKQKYRNAAKKFIEGDGYTIGWHETDTEAIAGAVELLNEREKRNKLSAADLALREEMKHVLPAFFQLVDKCMEESNKDNYINSVRERIIQNKKKAEKGDKAAIKEYNKLVKEWGKYEPDKFPPFPKKATPPSR